MYINIHMYISIYVSKYYIHYMYNLSLPLKKYLLEQTLYDNIIVFYLVLCRTKK